MLPDLRLAIRNLAKSRGFTAVAVLTLAVGLAATTTMFSTLRALVLSPLRYPEPDRLVMVWSDRQWPLSSADFTDLKRELTSFTDFGVYTPQSFNIGQENAQAVSGASVTSGVLRAFGVAPLHGRLFTPDDDKLGAPPVAILSYSLWKQTFGADPALVGREVRLNGSNVTVVGIMPPEFEFAGPWLQTTDCHVWQPLQFDPAKLQRDSHWLCGLARLKPGVAVATADAEAKALGKRLAETYPDSNMRKPFLVISLHEQMTVDTARQGWVLFTAVAFVLLVACANVASMLLARGARRAGEFGVRLALGATRTALVRLALAESFVIAGAGAALGLCLSLGGLQVMRVIAPTTEARKAAIALDLPVLGFVLGATVLTALIAGLPPALAGSRVGLASVIRSDSRGSTSSRHRLLQGLLIGQIALAFVLANGAAIFSGSYLKLLEENQQLATDRVLVGRVNLRGKRYDEDADRVRFWRALEERVKALPGVVSVGLTSKLPLEGGSNTNALVNDEVYDPKQRRMNVERSSVTEDYFAAAGLKLIQGRLLNAEDRTGEVRGVVVNQAMVAKAWPDKNPLGEIIRGNNPGKPWYVARVVGVVEDVRQHGAATKAQPEMYTTPEGHWGRSVYVLIRSAQPAAALSAALRAEVTALDSELAVERVRTLQQVVKDSTRGQRTMAGLVDAFMALALGLLAVGLYGTLSYLVQQRTREIGVRLAIGAGKGTILRLIFAQGGRWVATGLVLGALGVWSGSTLLKSVVYGMDGLRVVPLLLGGGAVFAAAALACWIPARRASRLDPLLALRAD
ncbi:ABC transporter permease [Oleiharenicola sp. Vm1]|uniref:ABC transporter permease n=1 Tax=Oleiharenicola sp. Vm1 TaxID=3398393 RepID=UPI0039F5C870